MSAEAAQNRSEDLICGSCGHVNPGENNFCGHCGQPLRHQAEWSTEAAAEPSPEQLPSFAEIFGLESPSQRQSREQTAISGPSFLGLDGDGAAPAPDFGYNEESGSHAGRWVALLVVLGLIAIGVAEWRSIRGVVLQRVAQLKSYAGSAPPPQPQAPPSPAATEQNPVSSTPTETASPEPARPTDASSGADAAKTDTTSAPSTSPPSTPETSEAQPDEGKNSAASAQPPEKSAKQEATTKNRRQDEVGETSPKKGRKTTGQVRRNRQIEMAKTTQAPDNSLVLAGEKYLYGRGAPRSCQQALVYFRSAARAQNARAMSHLGTMYATGTCVRQDRVQAYRWLSQALAEESNNHFLEQNLTMLWREMTPAEKQVVLTKSR